MGWAQRANDARRGGRTNWPTKARPQDARLGGRVLPTLGGLGALIEAYLTGIHKARRPKMKRGAYKRYRQRMAKAAA